MALRSGIYENVYEVVGLVEREREKREKDIHDENATLCSNPSKWEDPATDRGCFISRTNCFSTFRLSSCFIFRHDFPRDIFFYYSNN